MSLIEFLFIIFIALGIIPNSKLISYYKRFRFLINNSSEKRGTIGDESINEQWEWVEEDHDTKE